MDIWINLKINLNGGIFLKKSLFKGSGVAIVTPMNDDGSINYDSLGDIIEFQINSKTDAIIVCGTTGESATLTDEEHSSVIKFTVDRVNKRIPVIAGTGSNNTKHALELSLAAQELGVDGLLIVTPYYNKTSQKGLVKHYTYIADRVNLPIILYNVPSRTGCSISVDTCIKLSQHHNIVAIKEASGNISHVAKIIAACKDDLDVYSGNDDQTVAMMALGAKGVISVFANICPRQSHEICSEFFHNNISESARLQLKYLNLMNALFSDVNPIPIKEAMNMMGFKCGKCRMPLDSMSEDKYLELRNVMHSYGLII